MSAASICGDNRFELIAKARAMLVEDTNIEDRPDEMAVLDNVLFRCWQMGWLDQLGTGTCEMEYVSDWMSWHCKACDQMDMAPRNPKPRYCKWCGRKVVGDG